MIIWAILATYKKINYLDIEERRGNFNSQRYKNAIEVKIRGIEVKKEQGWVRMENINTDHPSF